MLTGSGKDIRMPHTKRKMISGKTGLIAHLGVPMESFKAPMIYNPFFEEHGIDVVVMPMGCETKDYPGFLRLLFKLRNIKGALITMPHKVQTVELLDEASIAVKIAGACNAVRPGPGGTLIGDLFDGVGFSRGVKRQGRKIEGASALIIGSGGVGSAIAASLAKAGTARLGLFDLRSKATEALADRLHRHYPSLELTVGSNDPVGWDMVVNATPLGMNGDDPMPLDVDRLEPSTFVGEVVMSKDRTPFLAAASTRGCQTQIGTDMLFEQIPAYLDFFGLPTTTPDNLRRLARIADSKTPSR